MNVYVCILCVAVSISFLFLSPRKNHIVSCEEMIARLHPHQLAGLDDLIEDHPDAQTLWIKSHGYSGLWKRWRNRVVFLQLYQARALTEQMTEAETSYMMKRMSKLTSETFKAALYGSARRFLPEAAALHGRIALKLYQEIAYWTHAAYSDDSVPLCAERIAEVL